MNHSTTYNIAVVGPEDIISGFRALGVHVHEAKNSNQALSVIKHLRDQTHAENAEARYGAIFVIDHLINDMPDEEYKKITSGALPSVITIPGLRADKEASKRKLRRLTEKAIGADILGND